VRGGLQSTIAQPRPCSARAAARTARCTATDGVRTPSSISIPTRGLPRSAGSKRSGGGRPPARPPPPGDTPPQSEPQTPPGARGRERGGHRRDRLLARDAGDDSPHRQTIERGLDPGDSAEVRGDPDAAADVGADAERRHAGGDRGALAPRRAARRVPEAPWV